jgi:hypothetical protein
MATSPPNGTPTYYTGTGAASRSTLARQRLYRGAERRGDTWDKVSGRWSPGHRNGAGGFVDVSAPGLGDCSILADDQVVTQAIRNQDRSAAHYTLKRDHPVDELTPRQRGTVAVRWVPGHAGVQGGEITDKAAKEGKMPSAGPANPGDGTEAAVDARSPLRGPSHAPPGSSPAEGKHPETEEHVRESRLSPLAC